MVDYDPGWRRYEPTQEEVLADLRREDLRAKDGGRVARLIRALPWPLRVIPPFLLAVVLPVLLLAVFFGVISSRSDSLQVPVLLRTEGPVDVRPASPEIDFGRGGSAKLSLWVTNSSNQDVVVRVSSPGLPSYLGVDEPAAQTVAPGETARFLLGVRRLKVTTESYYKSLPVSVIARAAD
jgi:hypothetical protein